jgi:hypothetical protein
VFVLVSLLSSGSIDRDKNNGDVETCVPMVGAAMEAAGVARTKKKLNTDKDVREMLKE